jgi:hypothetical protein
VSFRALLRAVPFEKCLNDANKSAAICIFESYLLPPRMTLAIASLNHPVIDVVQQIDRVRLGHQNALQQTTMKSTCVA